MLVQFKNRTTNVIEKFIFDFQGSDGRFFTNKKPPHIYKVSKTVKRDKKTCINHSTNFFSFSLADFIYLFTFRSDMFSNIAISFIGNFW